MPENGWGWIDLTKLALADGTDLLKSVAFDAPDDGNADDRTVIRVPLPSPVGPAAKCASPRPSPRSCPASSRGPATPADYHLVGQWFPKLGVYEPAGLRGRQTGGWNCHQYHANSEFYADFGSFDVRITVPSRFVVGATGRLQGKTPRPDGNVTWRYAQDDVHDFGWTADPSFVEVNGRLLRHARRDRGRVRGSREAGRSPARRDAPHRRRDPAAHAAGAHAASAALHGKRAAGHQALRSLVRTLSLPHSHRRRSGVRRGSGPAAWSTPRSSRRARILLLNRWPLDHVHVAEEVTIHEYGHQYWYGMVGSNEFEEAWLDEGFNSYSTGRLVDRLYGPETSMAAVLGLRVGHRDQLRSNNSPLRTFDRLRQPAWTYSPGSYGVLQLRPDRPDARDAGASARRTDDGARHAHVLGTLALPPSLERRLLRRGVGSGGPGSHVVLQARGRDS